MTFFLAQSSKQPIIRWLTFDPAFTHWTLLILLGIAAIASIVYLYGAQQKIAPPRIVRALTGIRIALIVLMLLLLLRPVHQWVNTDKSGGTFWIVADHSLSMAQKDPQATNIERLRWADALGKLPPDLNTGKLDRLDARLVALRDDLRRMQDEANAPYSEADASKRVESFARSIRDWNDKLQDVASKLEKDPHGQSGDGAAVAKDLRDIVTAVSSGLSQSEGKSDPKGAATDIPWQKTEGALDDDVKRLASTADRAADEFLRQYGSDQRVAQALNDVAAMNRADLALAALSEKSHDGSKSLAEVMGARNTKVLAFAGGQQVVPTQEKSDLAKSLKTALTPDGSSTNIADALKFVGEQLGSGEQASILVVSDGRENEGGDITEPAARLAEQGARVYTLAVGSRQIVRDAAVESVDAPDWIFKDDTLRASALLRLDGLSGQTCKVEFRRGDTVVDTQSVTLGNTDADKRAMRVVNFSDKPPEPGLYEYEVRIQPMPDEAVLDNNRQSVRVSVKKEKLHALVIENEPRWEYRYLTNYLSRDNRVQLQKVLLQPAKVPDVQLPTPVKASPTNPSDEAQLLPATKEEWAAFDMIVLGDVPPESLSPETQKNIAAAINDRGAALIVIAGPQYMPGGYAGTPLAEVLPVSLNSAWTGPELADQLKHGWRPERSREGLGSILSQFGLDEASNDELWSNLPLNFWHSEQTQVKAANVIWSIPETRADAAAKKSNDPDSLEKDRQHALLCTGTYGSGRVMYLASDSTWRLRQVNGQNLHERFWGQVVRWAVGNDLPAGGKLVKFGTNKPRYVGGEPVVVTARVLKEDLTPLHGQSFEVVARTAPEKDAAGNTTGAGKEVQRAKMFDAPEMPGSYRGTLSSLPPGPIELSLEGPEIEKLMASDDTLTSKTIGIDVSATSNQEMQNINADPVALARIAHAGGGIALDASYYDVLADHIPQVKQDQVTVEQVGLFTDPNDPWTRKAHWGFLIAFATLITAEWILRKVGGLV